MRKIERTLMKRDTIFIFLKILFQIRNKRRIDIKKKMITRTLKKWRAIKTIEKGETGV